MPSYSLLVLSLLLTCPSNAAELISIGDGDTLRKVDAQLEGAVGSYLFIPSIRPFF